MALLRQLLDRPIRTLGLAVGFFSAGFVLTSLGTFDFQAPIILAASCVLVSYMLGFIAAIGSMMRLRRHGKTREVR